MSATEEHQHSMVANSHTAHPTGMSGHRGRMEAGQIGDVDIGIGLPEGVSGGNPSRSEHNGDVVCGDTGETSDLGCSRPREDRRVGGCFAGGVGHGGDATAQAVR